MPVKILLADKSITIQKVVEMLFSGKEYEVHSTSDGESALAEAGRVRPDVILADVDLPRVDGYTFAGRLKQNAALAQTPVILMMSRDDVFDAAKGKQAGIIDNIAKPFESQDLIGKIKKALASAPPRLGEPAAAAPAPSRPAPAAAPPPSPPPPTKPKPKPTVPSDIFDIIQEAPSSAEVKKSAAPKPPAMDESVFEVEPEVEFEEPMAREEEKALPRGPKAVEEMRAGLGLASEPSVFEPEVASFESLGLGKRTSQDVAPPKAAREASPPPPRESEPKAPVLPTPAAAAAPPSVSEDLVREMLRQVAEEAVGKIIGDVIQKVAWEVIPDLAEQMIKEEIERLKAEK